MKTVIQITIVLIAGISTALAQAPTPPEPPKPPTKVEVAINGDIQDKNHYSSFSVIDEDDSYMVKARFNKYKTAQLKKFLFNEFGKTKASGFSKTYEWAKESAGQTVYEVRLSSGRLKLFVDKETASDQVVQRFRSIAKELKTKISKR